MEKGENFVRNSCARLPPPFWALTGRVTEGAAYVGRGKGRGSPRLGGGRGAGSHSTRNCIIFLNKHRRTTRANAFTEKRRKNLEKFFIFYLFCIVINAMQLTNSQ